MKKVLVTGSAGLIGSECVKFFINKGFTVIGVDNNMRKIFFGDDACTDWNRNLLEMNYESYIHVNKDIRDQTAMEEIFSQHNNDIKLIIHAAAQPSHDWAAREPFTDFSINANGTLILLEMARKYCPEAVFIFTSTNKVYGDLPNTLPLVELEKRWEIAEDHPFYKNGINETLSVDQSTHSLFGVSKLAADILVQEYGRYFNMKTGVFRGGCLTGPSHSGTQLHGFLSYLVKCAISGDRYTVFGYKGKQVRDNIHSYDFVNALYNFFKKPGIAEVYNMGGSRHSNCSILEAIEICENITRKKVNWEYCEKNRIGDHIWYISDVSKFKNHYSDWNYTYSIENIVQEIYQGLMKRNH
jgi:CDP-paratose 2-epimerase